jgi:hypothetical protein
MSHWFLRCENCAKLFPHAPISPQPDRLELLWPVKPDFPEVGQTLNCPHCERSALYQRHQLIVQPGAWQAVQR